MSTETTPPPSRNEKNKICCICYFIFPLGFPWGVLFSACVSLDRFCFILFCFPFWPQAEETETQRTINKCLNIFHASLAQAHANQSSAVVSSVDLWWYFYKNRNAGLLNWTGKKKKQECENVWQWLNICQEFVEGFFCKFQYFIFIFSEEIKRLKTSKWKNLPRGEIL